MTTGTRLAAFQALMPELSGSLASIDLARLVRFLGSMGKSGGLRLSRDGWVGQLSFLDGRLIGAAVENEQGLHALELIAVAFRAGAFEFSPSQGSSSVNLNLPQEPDPIAELERLADNSAKGPLATIAQPTAVPHIVPVRPSLDDAAAFTLDHSAVYVLLDINAQRSVRDLAARHGLLRTLNALERLRSLGLIAFEDAPRALPVPERVAVPPTPAPARSASARSWRDRFFDVGSLLRRAGIFQAIVVTGVLVLGIRAVVQNFRVEGISMLPNFGAGQVLVVSRAAYYHVDGTPLASVLPTTPQGSTRYVFGGPQRGDVVVFHSRVEPGADFIKRIVGLPGDLVEVRAGRVYVNGDEVDEPYIEFSANYDFPSRAGALVIPDRQYFVLGDNRPDSFDSHAGWLVDVDDLIGRAWIRYWPPSQVGILQSGSVQIAQRPMESSSAVSRSTNGLP